MSVDGSFVTASEQMGINEITSVLEDNNGSPQCLLKHNEARATIVTWRENPKESNYQYSDLMDEISFRSAGMVKSDWESELSRYAEKYADNNTGTDGDDSEPPVHELSPTQFYESEDWDQMQDRAMARKCHKWIKENENIIFSNETVFAYKDGIWEEHEGKVTMALQKLIRNNYGSNVKSEFIDGYVKAHPTYHIDWEEMGIDGTKAAVENGILDIMEGTIIRELEPEDHAIMRIPVEWNGLDAERPMWEEFIQASVEPSSRDTIQEYTGSCLHTNEYPFKKAMMLLGDGDNGKGVFENVVTAMLGHDNVTHDGLKKLANSQFGLQRLQYKTANIHSDINRNKIINKSMFKSLTGNDRIRVEAKYKTPSEMRNPAKLIFGANRIPKVKDAGRAFYRRWILVQFPNRFTLDDDDEYLDAIFNLDKDIIEEELPGVLAWAVEGYQRLQNNKNFTGEKTPDRVQQDWEEYQDTTTAFVRNFVTSGNPRNEGFDHRMRVDRMHEFYEKYVQSTPTSGVSKKKLNKRITDEHRYPGADTKPSRRAVRENEGINTTRVWEGVYISKAKREEINNL